MAHALNTGRRALAGYSPSVLGGFALHADHRGVWTVQDLERMRRDSRIRLGLAIIKAPLQTVTWTVKGENQEVVDWVDRTLRTVWKNHLSQLLLLVDYGRTGGEPVWKHDEATGLVELKCLDFVHPYDLVPLERGGEWCGVRVKGLSGKGWLLMPNAFYVVNDPEFNIHYGRSRLLGAWEPFQEKSARHGAKDIRRLWYVKNAYRGGVMRHPMGVLDLGDGSVRTCQDYAREIVEKAETGGVMALPNTRDDSGSYQWEYEDPKSNGDIGGVREYVHDLDDEIFEGMEIPREIVEAAQGGGSWAGRTVPFLIYLAGEDRIVSNLIGALEKQLLRPGVDANFGEDAKFSIEPKSLIPPDEEAQAKEQAGGLGGAMGGAPEEPAPEEEAPPADPIAELLGGEQMSAVRLAEDAWVPYIGKRGASKGKQVGWQNKSTKRIVYGERKPGSAAEKKIAAKSAKAEAKPKPTKESVTAHAKKVLETPTAEGVLELIDGLLSLKVADMKAVRDALGAKGGKTKSDLARKIKEKLEEKKEEVKPEEKPKTEEKPKQKAPRKGKKKDEAKPTEEVKSEPEEKPKTGQPFRPEDHHETVKQAVRSLGALREGLADIADIRDAMASAGLTDRAQQDEVIRDLRKKGVLTGSAYEGRHGITDRQREAMIREPGGENTGFLTFREGQNDSAKASEPATPIQPHWRRLEGGDYEYTEPPPPQERVDAVASRLTNLLSTAKPWRDDRYAIADLREAMPDASPREFDEAMKQLRRSGVVRFITYDQGSMDVEPRHIDASVPGVAERFPWVEFTPQGGLGDDEDSDAPKPDQSSQSPEPGFTGIDALGREWRDGQLVAKQEEPASPPAPSAEAREPLKLRRAGPLPYEQASQMRELFKGEGSSVKMADAVKTLGQEAVAKLVASGQAREVRTGLLRTKQLVLTSQGEAAIQQSTAETEIREPRTMREIEDLQKTYDLAGPEERKQIRGYLGFNPDKEVLGTLGAAIARRLQKSLNATPIGDRITSATRLHAVTSRVAALETERQAIKQELEDLKKQDDELKARQVGLLEAFNLTGKAKKLGLQELAKVQKQLEEIRPLLQEAAKRAREINKRSRTEAHKILREVLQVSNPAQVETAKPDFLTGSEDLGALNAAESFLAGLVAKGPQGEDLPLYEVTRNTEDVFNRGHASAYYESDTHAINVIAGTNASTNVHEMAHGIEYKMPGAQSAALAFLAHRVKDEPLQNLNEATNSKAYGEWEMGRKDDFEKVFGSQSWYVGKKSTERGSTEIVSMGVQMLHDDPSGFAAKDPEYFTFICGILNGDLRDKDIPKE